jgi:aldehyde reductase
MINHTHGRYSIYSIPFFFQVEAHVYLNQKSMIELCRQYGIVVTAYGPLGRPGLSQDPVNDPTLLDDHQIKEIAAKYGRTVAQILLRYLVYEYNLRLLLFEKGKKKP